MKIIGGVPDATPTYILTSTQAGPFKQQCEKLLGD